MSTHQLDASGSRPLTTTVNDQARTTATVSARPGDEVAVTLGNFAAIEIPLPPTPGAIALVRREKPGKRMKRDDAGEIIRDENKNPVYEDYTEVTHLLRFGSLEEDGKPAPYFIAFGRQLADEKRAGTPHTSLRVARFDRDPHKPNALVGDDVQETVLVLGEDGIQAFA